MMSCYHHNLTIDADFNGMVTVVPVLFIKIIIQNHQDNTEKIFLKSTGTYCYRHRGRRMIMSNTSQQMIYTSTEYSGNARALKPCDIINRAVAMKADAVIVADHNTMCAAPEIIAAAHQNNMKASVGIKLTICYRNYQ